MPLQNTRNNSTNWSHLKNILSAYSNLDRQSKTPSLEDHIHAKAMAAFLVRATLATPFLDRNNVDKVLTGQLKWPTSANVSQFKGVNVQLSFLEDNGFVSFYAGWLNVNCCTPSNLESIHPSFVPLIEAVNHLKDICYGRNCYIQPHFICAAQDFEESLSDLPGKVSVLELLPSIRLEEGYYHLRPGNKNFSPLVSTYLWHAFNEKEPEQAFKNWITCLRVNCEFAMPVLFKLDENEERNDFNEKLVAWIANDSALQKSITTLQKQFLNEYAFSSIVSSALTQDNLKTNLEGDTKSSRAIELEKNTYEILSSTYSVPQIDGLSDLQGVKVSSQFHTYESEIFYTSLLAAATEESIRIDDQTLFSSGFIEALLDLAATRPTLKYIMFNVLPQYWSASYKLFLLSNLATCNVALFYLTQRLMFRRTLNESPAMLSIEKGFSHMVRDEFLRTIRTQQQNGELLLEVVEFLIERIDLQTADFSLSPEYRILIDILDNLQLKDVVQLADSFSHLISDVSEGLSRQPKDHNCYLLGFWLIDYFDNAGMDSTDPTSQSIKTKLINCYEAEFNDNVAGKRWSLEPSSFFSTLPWHKLFISDYVDRLLALSNTSNKWNLTAKDTEKNPIQIALAIRQYLQVLICVGKLHRIGVARERVASRVVEVVRMFGFSDEADVFYLFHSHFDTGHYDIWKSFCSYSNVFSEELYSEFFERSSSRIPLNQLFVLLEHTTISGRSQTLQDHIVSRQSLETLDMGLVGLEQAFVSACNFGHMDLAENLLQKSKDILAERFENSTNHRVKQIRRLWLVYEYKWALISEADKLKATPKLFAEFAHNLKVPFSQSSNQDQPDDGKYWRECTFFRRYIIAAAYLEADPKKSVGIMDVLCNESKANDHRFMRFVAKAAVCNKNKNLSELRQALLQFIDDINDIVPDQMLNLWVAKILDTYKNLKDWTSIDFFWERLSIDQKNRTEILHPYCKSLIDRGDKLVAMQVLDRYRDHNQEMPEDVKIDELINELVRERPEVLTVRNFIRDINEQSQRSKVQLARHYRQIICSEFRDYVDIVSQGITVEEFLGKIVLEVAQELVLRKKNLQLHSDKAGYRQNCRITKEDLINDWFTSLFNKRMAEARISFEDQKRGGKSASGHNPGEIDGYLTDAKNNRIAIFEAFRLFSNDTTVISEHLNKIRGYDNESLSPVFIAVYCDVSEFDRLVCNYTEFITKAEYDGFNRPLKDGHAIIQLINSDHIWMGMESRKRGAQEVFIYHLLLNMGD